MEATGWVQFWTTFGLTVLLPALAGAAVAVVLATRSGRSGRAVALAAVGGLALGAVVGFKLVPLVVVTVLG